MQCSFDSYQKKKKKTVAVQDLALSRIWQGRGTLRFSEIYQVQTDQSLTAITA